MKVDNNADPRDFLFLMIEKNKQKNNPTSPSVFIILPVCAPSSEKKTVFLADAALIPDSDTCKV